RGRIRHRGEVPIGHLAIERADRLADKVHDGIPDARDLGANGRIDEVVQLAIDPEDGVLVVAAVDRDAPHPPATGRAAVVNREVDAAVAHLADVLDRWTGLAGRR